MYHQLPLKKLYTIHEHSNGFPANVSLYLAAFLINTVIKLSSLFILSESKYNISFLFKYIMVRDTKYLVSNVMADSLLWDKSNIESLEALLNVSTGKMLFHCYQLVEFQVCLIYLKRIWQSFL